jgi:hypothetical protein
MAAPREVLSFGPLHRADRVVVTDNMNRTYTTVDDPEVIGRLADWLVEREGDWYQPRDGVRIMKLRLNFSLGGQPIGNVGLGRKYLTAHQLGEFFQRDAAPTDRAEALAIIGLEDPDG